MLQCGKPLRHNISELSFIEFYNIGLILLRDHASEGGSCRQNTTSFYKNGFGYISGTFPQPVEHHSITRKKIGTSLLTWVMAYYLINQILREVNYINTLPRTASLHGFKRFNRGNIGDYLSGCVCVCVGSQFIQVASFKGTSHQILPGIFYHIHDAA